MTNEEIKKLETELWGAADNLRANSKLTAAEYNAMRLIDTDYKTHMKEIHNELADLNTEANNLMEQIQDSTSLILKPVKQ
jgi:hypothetical protein